MKANLKPVLELETFIAEQFLEINFRAFFVGTLLSDPAKISNLDP